MRVLITGGAGVLGSALAEFLLDKGYSIRVVDIVKKEEAWRLGEVIDSVEYVWKAVEDLEKSDLEGCDLIIHCAAQPDRPLGNYSPLYTVYDNVIPTLHLLELSKKLSNKPYLIYPSSLNEYYGLSFVNERTSPKPSSIYGFSKAAASMLFETYHLEYGLKTIVTVVGSAFGKRMRSDELIAKLIIYGLKGRKFILKSPESKRLWCYSKDVLNFYEKLLQHLDECVGKRLICAGNKGDEILTNVQLAEKVKKFVPLEYTLGDYEPGELIDGKPVDFKIDGSYTRNLLGWKPKYSVDEGLKETVDWFKQNIWRYL